MSAHRKKPRPKADKPVKRPHLIVVLVFCLILIVVLLFYAPAAHVRVEVTTTRIEFGTTTNELPELLKAFDTKSIQISSALRLSLGSGSIELPSKILAENASLDIQDPNASVTVSGPPIARIQFPKDTICHVLLAWSESSPEVIQVTFNPADGGALSPSKRLHVACDYCLLRGLRHADLPGPLDFWFGSNAQQGQETGFELRDARFRGALSLSSSGAFVVRGIPVRDVLRFDQVEGDRDRSTILDGKAIISSGSSDIERQLGSSALVKFDRIKDFQIDEIKIHDGLKVTVSGEVSRLLVSKRNVLPTLAQGQNGVLTLIMAAIAALGTVALSIPAIHAHVFPKEGKP